MNRLFYSYCIVCILVPSKHFMMYVLALCYRGGPFSSVWNDDDDGVVIPLIAIPVRAEFVCLSMV